MIKKFFIFSLVSLIGFLLLIKNDSFEVSAEPNQQVSSEIMVRNEDYFYSSTIIGNNLQVNLFFETHSLNDSFLQDDDMPFFYVPYLTMNSNVLITDGEVYFYNNPLISSNRELIFLSGVIDYNGVFTQNVFHYANDISQNQEIYISFTILYKANDKLTIDNYFKTLKYYYSFNEYIEFGSGYQNSYYNGYQDGKIAGFEDGKIAGFEDGKIVGFLEGVESVELSNNLLGTTIFTTVGAVAGFIVTLGQFEIFGVSILTLISFVLLFGLLLVVLKVLK